VKKILIIVLLVFTYTCSDADDRLAGESFGLSIFIVDEKNDAFKVQTVRWWYSGEQDNKHELECDTELCAEWQIEEEISGSIVIHADTSIVKDDDEYCWDLYAGKAVVETLAREVTIVMTFTSVVCSSHKTIHHQNNQ